jgi:hypothetical protein
MQGSQGVRFMGFIDCIFFASCCAIELMWEVGIFDQDEQQRVHGREPHGLLAEQQDHHEDAPIQFSACRKQGRRRARSS